MEWEDSSVEANSGNHSIEDCGVSIPITLRRDSQKIIDHAIVKNRRESVYFATAERRIITQLDFH